MAVAFCVEFYCGFGYFNSEAGGIEFKHGAQCAAGDLCCADGNGFYGVGVLCAGAVFEPAFCVFSECCIWVFGQEAGFEVFLCDFDGGGIFGGVYVEAAVHAFQVGDGAARPDVFRVFGFAGGDGEEDCHDRFAVVTEDFAFCVVNGGTDFFVVFGVVVLPAGFHFVYSQEGFAVGGVNADFRVGVGAVVGACRPVGKLFCNGVGAGGDGLRL